MSTNLRGLQDPAAWTTEIALSKLWKKGMRALQLQGWQQMIRIRDRIVNLCLVWNLSTNSILALTRYQVKKPFCYVKYGRAFTNRFLRIRRKTFIFYFWQTVFKEILNVNFWYFKMRVPKLRPFLKRKRNSMRFPKNLVLTRRLKALRFWPSFEILVSKNVFVKLWIVGQV